MPVPKQIKLMMNSLKSAELIRELKAETEKLVETNSMVVRPESDLHDIRNLDGGYNYDRKLNNLSSLRRNVIPYPDHNYGQQPPLTPPEQASPDPNEQTDTGNEDEDEEGVTRCICGFAHDDGYMICCDRCGSWQHIDCMGIKSDSVPETYHCDRCEPRQLDVERARAIQQRKKDTLTDDDGDEDTDTEEESGQTYTAVSNTPTRITLTATPVIKKRGKNRLKSTSSEGNTKQRKRVNRKRQRTSTGQMSETTLQIDSNSLESHSGFENFQEIEENIYDPAIKSLGLEDTEETTDHNISKKFMVADVVENRKGIVSIEAIKIGQIITEYKGKMLLKATYEESNPFFKRSCPFLLHYNKIDALELVIDARTVGNEARYIRRSCTPNSDVIHVVKDGNLHILVQSKQSLDMGTEITIPFDYPLETYTGFLNCACKEPTCLVFKHNQRYLPQSGRKRSRYSVPDATSSTRNSASENQGETDSDENELDVGRPMSRRKKLSREERKLQAYLKQIEKMEKKEKRVKDPKAPQRPGLIQDQIQTQASLLTKSLQSFDTNASPNQAVSMTRRIAACTPGSGKKRININKKRPRISSCSSDPLSPELINCSLTSTATTPVQEQATHTQILDQNGHFKQKTRKDRIQDGLSLSVNIDRTLPNFRDVARKSRREYLDAVAGSPTPPSTPGQLSPAASHQQNNLSVETSNHLLSPTGTYLSVHERRTVLNGLLQIADPNDDQSNCSGSPQHTVITSNGIVTSEEVMGEMVLRESAPHTPTGRVPQRRLSNDCRYFGSLKKRWLIQYDRHTPFDIQPRNGLSTCIMSNCLNDTSIQKRAEQIASYVFKTPKSVTLSKKHRMRETMLYASEYLKEITRERSYRKSGDLAEKTEPVSVDNSSSPTSNKKETPNLASEKTISTTTDFVERIQSYDPTDSLEKPCLGSTTVSVNNEHSASEKTHIELKVDSTDSLNEKLLNATDCNDTNVCTEDGRTLPLKEEYKTFTQHQIAEGNQLVTSLVLPDKKNGSYTTLDKDRKIKNISNSVHATYLAGPLLTGSSDNALAFANSDLNEQEHDHRNSNGKIFSYAPMDETDQQKTSNKLSTVSVNDSFTKFHVNNVTTIEGSVQKTESAVIDLPMHSGDVRALSILRDPRLSSSSSRSSRDSTDGNILVRSDSVSSLEDVSLQRANVDKKSVNDKTDGMRHAKKKMSLREYRNRKKTKPAATLIHGASTINEGLAAKTLSQSILFTDTDSLLTPRTLSLSTGFTPLSCKDVTLTTSSSDSVSMTTLMSSQIPIETPSTEPLFEPVSPGDDFVAETMPNDEVKSGTSLSYPNFPLVAHDLQPHEFMEVDGEVTPVGSQAIVCQPESEIMSRKDPRKHYNYNPTQILTQQTTNFSYHPQELQSSLQRSKNIGSNSPIYRQAQAYNQHFRG